MHRNQSIFENKPGNVLLVISKVLGAFKEIFRNKGLKKQRILKAPSFNYNFNCSFFDGASQGFRSCYGIGMVVYGVGMVLYQSHFEY